MQTRHDRGIHLVPVAAILAVVLAAVVVASIVLVSALRGRARDRQAACADNLARIYEALHVYRTRFGGGTAYPPHLGAAFITCLGGDSSPIHPATYSSEAPLAGHLERLQCPAKRGDAPGTDYRGPQLYVPFGGPSPHPSALGSSTPPSHPVACDKAGNHASKAGNVLRFDGAVRFDAGEEFEEALGATE